MVVADDEPAPKNKLAGREISVFARKIVIERERQLGGVARRRVLPGIRQPRGIAVERVAHPELLGLAVHHVGKGGLAAGEPFGQHRGGVVCRFGDDAEDQILHGDRFAGPQAELGRRLARRLDADRKI